MPEPLRTAAIRAEPEAFDVARPKLMGRQAAGAGFLRAAVEGRGEGPMYGYASSRGAFDGFAQIARGFDPAVEVHWIHMNGLSVLGDPGVLYIGDSTVANFAELRLRAGPAAFGICGVTHTTASRNAMDSLADLLSGPVQPWDALICTSQAVLETVGVVLDAHADYLRWRFGAGVEIPRPELPVIPLGVHCADFEFSEAERRRARETLGLAEGEVAALFVGRFAFHAKAHPHAMYAALQAVAERTGRKLALIQSGWAANPGIDQVFRDGAARYAPAVKSIFVEGRDEAARTAAWAASDIFVSLSDNIQETFGLTPVEAMAAGLPCVVTDWNGYKDTVRDGIDGFRVRTFAPEPGMAEPIALAFEASAVNYDRYCWMTAAVTAVDPQQLAERLEALVLDPDLRRRMGDAGRKRAREVYDWAVVFRQYQALWGEQNARRLEAMGSEAWKDRLAAAPRAAAARQDPFKLFGHYPTEQIGPATRLAIAPGFTPEGLRGLLADPLFSQLPCPAQDLQDLAALVARGPTSPGEAALALGKFAPPVVRAAGVLAKMGCVVLQPR